MNDLAARLLSAITQPVQQRVALGFRLALLLLIAVIAALVAVGFVAAAVTIWLGALYGPVIAALIVAAGFAALALILAAVAFWTGRARNGGGGTARRQTRTTVEAEPLADVPPAAASASEAAPLLDGLKFVTQLKPYELLGLAVIAGFLAGRGSPRKGPGAKTRT